MNIVGCPCAAMMGVFFRSSGEYYAPASKFLRLNEISPDKEVNAGQGNVDAIKASFFCIAKIDNWCGSQS
ncbi:MAG TPA: hypothetical protein VHU44_18645 [Acidobacteriaceae bacterium]|jgi:hypothetical protein|nr:hypothetical protein [Acidobacteriaceae bacterium]